MGVRGGDQLARTGDVGEARVGEVAVADDDGVEHLLLYYYFLLLLLPRVRHLPAAAGLPADAEHLRLELNHPMEVEPPGELLEVPEHLGVAREPPRVAGIGGDQGEVEESHGLARQVGAERRVEARVVIGADLVVVEPGAAHAGAALEDDDGAVALAPELPRRRQPRRPRADHRHAQRSHRGARRWRNARSISLLLPPLSVSVVERVLFNLFCSVEQLAGRSSSCI